MTKQTTAQTEGATPVSAGALVRVVWHCGWQKTGAVDFMLAANRSPLAKPALHKRRRLAEDTRTLFINAAHAAPDPTSDAADQTVPTRRK